MSEVTRQVRAVAAPGRLQVVCGRPHCGKVTELNPGQLLSFKKAKDGYGKLIPKTITLEFKCIHCWEEYELDLVQDWGK